MAMKQKIFSSIRDNKYSILKKYSEYYHVSEAEIIRTIIERVLGNKKLERTIIHEHVGDLIETDTEIDLNIITTPLQIDIPEKEEKIPEICPECGEKEDAAGNSIIKVDRNTNRWSCSNCFASGGI
jgi:predicted RNA-binding Zn-ribbon protein involved in translation (DUF1610 family)